MDTLSAARAVLPFWLPLVSLASMPLAFAAAWLVSSALTPFAYRRVLGAQDSHWTSRARLAWPARKWTGLGFVAIPAVLGALVAHLGGPFSLLGPAAAGLLGGAAALLGYALGTWPVARRLYGDSIGGRGRFLSNALSLLLVRAPHLVAAAAVAAFMPPRFTGHGAVAAALLAAGTVLVFASAFGGGLAIGRLLGLFREGDERLGRAAFSAASDECVATPETLVMRSHLPVAFAIPLRRILVFSEPALALLDDAELAAVVAHETSHLTESRAITLQRMSGLLVFTLLMAAPSLAGEGGRTAFFTVLFALLALVAAGAFSRRTAREMEGRADAHAREHSEGGVYARALEKMHEAALVPAILGSRNATHPDLWDRMKAAGAPPSWPKPAPPASGRLGRFALLFACALLFVAAEAGRGRTLAALTRRSPLAAVALSGGEAWPLSELAMRRAAANGADAVSLYRACFALDGRPSHLANAAFLENRAGRCDEARALAAKAVESASGTGVATFDRYLAGRAADAVKHCGVAEVAEPDDD